MSSKVFCERSISYPLISCVRTFTFTENLKYMLNECSQTTIRSVCFILIIIIRIIVVGILFIEISIRICFCWNASARFALTNNCAHHCLANKTVTIKKTTIFKGAWYTFQYSIICWFFLISVHAKFRFIVCMPTEANWKQ